MKELTKGIMKMRLSEEQLEALNKGVIIRYNAPWLPFDIELDCPYVGGENDKSN